MATGPSGRAAKGMEGVVVADTALSHVDGEAGRLIFRGHDAARLAEQSPFEAVWYLLFEGRLPNAAELAAHTVSIAKAGHLTAGERAAVERAAHGEPLAAIRTAVSGVAALRGLRPWLYRDAREVRQEALALAASLPRIVLTTRATFATASMPSIDPAAPYAAAYLQGILARPPEPWQVKALDRYFALAVDHGMNASTFVARAVTSTGADLGAVVVAALGALSGPLHGGAPTGVLEMLDAIERPERADAWLREWIGDGKRVMGFGHRVYRTEDPRSRSLKAIALQYAGERAQLALAVEAAAQAALAELKPGRPLYPNVEFWAAVVLEACGIPRSLFTATVCCSRVVGWMAHALEQMADNRIIRPTSNYIGPLVTA